MKQPTPFTLLLSLIFAATTTANPLQLELPSAISTTPSVLNVTNLQQHSTCFRRTVRQRLHPTTHTDCSAALTSLIGTEQHFEIPYNFSQNSTTGNFKLPFSKEYKSCKIKLFTREYDDVVAVSMAEIYNNLVDEKMGLFSNCLTMPYPFGGETSLGWNNPVGGLLFVDVRGVQTFEKGNVETA